MTLKLFSGLFMFHAHRQPVLLNTVHLEKIDKDDTYDNHLSVILVHLQSTNTNRVILLEILE
jgi:hypothetical protein